VVVAINSVPYGGISTSSIIALKEFVAKGGRLVMLAGYCETYFASRMAPLAASSCPSGGCQYVKPTSIDLRADDFSHPLLKDWKFPHYNFTNTYAAQMCVTPVDPTGWVALTAAGDASRQVLTSFTLGDGVFVWFGLNPMCKDGVCYEGDDAKVLSSVIQRAVALPVKESIRPPV
jgi:hypothetical protein